MTHFNHWQIALNSVCVIPPKGVIIHDNSSKWMTDRAPQIFVDPVEYESMDAVIDAYLKAGEYSVLKYLYKFDIPDHTKIKRITMRRKVLSLTRSRKHDDVIRLHLAGYRNCDICKELDAVKQYVSQVIKRYKAKERENAS